jgi:hypothetical protein
MSKFSKISFALNLSLEDIIYIIADLQKIYKDSSRATKELIFKFSTVVCETNSYYIRCNNPDCQKLLLKNDAIIGEKTKIYQEILIKQQSESQINHDDVDYQKDGKSHRVLYFCSNYCDGYFSSKLQFTLQNIIDVTKKNVEDIKDKSERLISIYENNTNKTEEEINKIKKDYEMQRKIKINHEILLMSKEIKEITKKFVG